MQVISSFLRGILYGLAGGVLTAIILLALVYFTVGLNDSNGIVNAYTLFLCAIFGIIGSIVGGIIGLIKGFIDAANPTFLETKTSSENNDPISKP